MSRLPIRHAGLMLTLALAAATAATAAAAQGTDAGRGRLLYDNHCGACHGTQMHWRDRKLVTDWATLVAEVRRWQAADHLGWSEAEVTDVARHLNTLHYHFPLPGARVGAAPAAGLLR